MNDKAPNPVDYQVPDSIAALWSMMLPGLGQMMKGAPLAGIIWGLAVAGGYYAFFWPGLLLHGLCILEASFAPGERGLKAFNWPQRLIGIGVAVVLLGYIYYRNV